MSAASVRTLIAKPWLAGAAAIVCSCAYLTPALDQRWYPWDEGFLGQAAERTLAGQLPHRDFADIYTGGLSFFDAGVFWLFGADLLWLRVAMVPFFVAFVAATFSIAARLVKPWLAALLTFTVVVWTVPNYPAAMPSWFNLFFAVAGVACVFEWMDDRSDAWLWLAGFLGGLSVVVKIVGIYYLGGVLFFLVFRAALHEGACAPAADRDRRLRLAAAYGLSIFALGATLWTIRPRLGAPELIAFVPPVAAAAAVLAVAARRSATSAEPIFAPAARFLVGAAMPIVIFVTPYLTGGGWHSLVYDVFESAQTRLQFAARPPLPARSIWAVAPFLFCFLVARLPRRAGMAAAAALAVAYLLVLPSQDVTRYFMNPIRELLPPLALASAAVLVLALRRGGRTRGIEALSLLFFVAAFDSLIQFPFGKPIYFQYVLPLVVLAAVSFLVSASGNPGIVGTVVLCAYLIAGVLHLQPGAANLWHRLGGSAGLVTLSPSRGRILVSNDDARTYQEISSLLRAHARNGVTLAGPDTPEIYYLTGLTNPTRMMFDFLTPARMRTSQLMRAARSPDVTAVVVNESPPFSRPYSPQLMSFLLMRFSHHTLVGHFDVRWRA